ncbi:MAG: 2-hydroxycyclohexanecarboxyl-CoA dehydrogenase [Deltaproteobacteria bacterium]|nr:2-hydroxycyclohexanecarboxyl-CoA dehydrogenase [Deltaproteobacteria bacterium]
MDLKGKVAIVTGAGGGIGRAISVKFASLGANVVVADIKQEGAGETVSLVEKAGTKGLAMNTDITSLPQVQAMVKKTLEAFGQVDILVNNAGWDKIEPFVKNSPELWDRVISINLKGPIHCTRAVLDPMMERKYGKIISISSDAGRVGSTGEAVYSACKGGIIAFTKTMAREMARYQINVNCICPGATDTPLLAEITGGETGAKIIEAMVKAVPFRRLGKPEDIAGAVAFLASDEASFITGQTLSVSGGLTMC